jgi:hypothetical protein
MLRRIVYLKPVPYPRASSGGNVSYNEADTIGIKIIHHQNNLFCVREALIH